MTGEPAASFAGSAVAALARAERGRAPWSTLLIGVMVGLIAAAAFGAAAVAHRTWTAYDRLARDAGFPDMVAVGLPPAEAQQARTLPGVAQSSSSLTIVGQLDAPGQVYLSLSIAPTGADRLGRPAVVRGREVSPLAPDEAVIAEGAAEEFGLDLGDSFSMALLTREEFSQFGIGFGEPDGPRLPLRIVGIARYPQWASYGIGAIQVSPALESTIAPDALSLTSLRCAPDADCAAVAAQVQRIAGAVDEDDPLLAPTVQTRPAPDPAVSVGRQVGAAVLIGAATVVGIGGLLVLWQVLGARDGSRSAQRAVESAIGLRRWESALAQSAALLPAALIAAGVALLGCLAAGAIEPLGHIARYEPRPGWHAPAGWAIAAALCAGAIIPASAYAVACLPRAHAGRAGGEADGAAPRPLAPRLLVRGPVGFVAAARLRPAGDSAARAGGSWLALAIAVAAVTAVATLALSAAQVQDRPADWGWAADFAVQDVRPEQIDQLREDPRVAAAAQLTDSQLTIEAPDGARRSIAGFGITPVKGAPPMRIVAGRMPSSAAEIALAPRTASELEAAVGDRLRVIDGDGAAHELLVCGIVATPPLYNTPLGEHVLTTADALPQLSAARPAETALVRARPADSAELIAHWRGQAEIIERNRPSAIDALAQLGALPALLILLFGAIGVLVLAYGLAADPAARRTHVDVLRAIGFTPRQAAGAQIAAALQVAAIGLAVGVPLGLLTARLLWSQIGAALGFAPRLAGLWPAAGAVAGATLAAALLSAAPLALSAARQRGSTGLRAE